MVVGRATAIGNHFAGRGVWETPGAIPCTLESPRSVPAHFEGTSSHALSGAMITFMGTRGTLSIDRGRYEITAERGQG